MGEGKLDWLRGYLKLENGIPSHDTFGRLFGLIDPQEFEAAFRRWVRGVVPVLGAEVVVIDGKSGRRSGKADAAPLHRASAFAAGAGLVLVGSGQRRRNPTRRWPEGCIVTINAMGTQSNIAQAVRERGADYVLAVKDDQALLADSIRDFFTLFKAAPERTPHTAVETVEKDHGWLENHRCYVFDQLELA